MKGFIDILIENGYKGYPNNHTDVPCKDPYFYSTYNPIIQIFKKDPKDDWGIVWGLSDSKPPTLIHPRPKISVTDANGKYIANEVKAEAMQVCLDNVDNQVIFDIITGAKKVREGFSFEFVVDGQKVKDITKYQ
jgi:hypothetical protein